MLQNHQKKSFTTDGYSIYFNSEIKGVANKMKPYDQAQKDCVYGSFDLDKKAGYILNKGDKLKGPWYYVYSKNITLCRPKWSCKNTASAT